jgi:hypothetical protein
MELIDGNPVVSHVVRFKDRTEISDRDADAVKDGAVVVWIVRTRCQPPSYHSTRKDSDDRYRFNVQTVEAAAVLHGELRDGALAYLDDPTQTQGRFVFDHPTHGPAEVKEGLVFREVDLQTIEEPVPLEPYRVEPEPELEPEPAPTTTTVEERARQLAEELAGPDDPVSEAVTRVVGYVYGNHASETHKLMGEMWDDL